MSNIDDFDIGLMSSKFAQRWFLVCCFYCKKISIQSSLYDAENGNCYFFLPPYITLCHSRKITLYIISFLSCQLRFLPSTDPCKCDVRTCTVAHNEKESVRLKLAPVLALLYNVYD